MNWLDKARDITGDDVLNHLSDQSIPKWVRIDAVEKFHATFDPPTVAAMLDALEAAERAKGLNAYPGGKTDVELSAALDRVRLLLGDDE